MSVAQQRYAYSYLVDKGFTPNAAAGIVGNLIQESGVDPRSNQVGGPGMGIAQWTESERWQSLLNFARTRNRDPFSLDLQLDFMLLEMKQYGLYGRMKNMFGLEKATRLFMNVFERPDPRYANIEARIQFARTLREKDPNMATSAKKDRGGNDGGGGGGGGRGGGGGGDRDDKITRAEYGFSDEFLERNTEIKQLVDRAFNQQWTVERFLAEVQETKWWRQTTAAKRQWQKLIATEPAEAEAQIQNSLLDVKRIAASLGVDINDKTAKEIATWAVRNGFDSVDITQRAARQYQYGKDKAEEGAAGVTVDQLRVIAEEYGIKLDRHTMDRMTQQVISGNQTVEGMIDRIREQAKTMYPKLGNKLDTHTVRDLLDPYLNMAADELGIPTVNMKTSDPRWLRFLGGKDGPLSIDEAQTLVRTSSDYGWDKTFKGRQEASQVAGALIDKMVGV